MLPQLTLDPGTLAGLDADLDREWLVTNGLGGYALGSVSGATTRCYSGLLVAAVRPPTERAMLVAKIDEVVTLPGADPLALGTNEYADGTIYPRGFERLGRRLAVHVLAGLEAFEQAQELRARVVAEEFGEALDGVAGVIGQAFFAGDAVDGRCFLQDWVEH